jgi:hypothetical protein
MKFFILLGLFLSVTLAEDDHGEAATSFTEETFKSQIGEKAHFVMFFAPW